ncbi:MAG: tetratricopeptide repeat protein [Spirochaetales bacterium]|nr:tetratricopeptide repeat protein [Spirochaetales bacterium]
MKGLYRIVFLFSILHLMGCSSAPNKPDEVVDKKNRAVEYAEYGNNYFNQGMYSQALNFFNLSLAYNGAVYNEVGMIQSYNSIGKVYIALDEMEKADESFLSALNIALLINDSELIAQSINNQGELLLKQKEYDRALEKFMEALKPLKVLAREKLSIIYHNIGIVYKRKNDPDTSLKYFEKALSINLGKKKHEEIASNYYMISSLYAEKGEYEIAYSFALKALGEDKKVENSLGIAKDFQALGIIMLKTGKEREAYDYFKNCYFVYKSMKNIYPNFVLAREIELCLSYLKPLQEKFKSTDSKNEPIESKE